MGTGMCIHMCLHTCMDMCMGMSGARGTHFWRPGYYTAMAYIVMAYIVKAHIFTVMAHIAMAYIVMAHLSEDRDTHHGLPIRQEGPEITEMQ